MDTNHQSEVTKSPISVGAGIAIAGVWLAAMVMEVTLWVLDYLEWKTSPHMLDKMNWFGGLIYLVVLFLPIIVAFYVTKRILNQQSD